MNFYKCAHDLLLKDCTLFRCVSKNVEDPSEIEHVWSGTCDIKVYLKLNNLMLKINENYYYFCFCDMFLLCGMICYNYFTMKVKFIVIGNLIMVNHILYIPHYFFIKIA